MITKGDFLFSKDKHQHITNNVSPIDKTNQYSNLYLDQNCPFLIPVQYSNNPKNDKYYDSKVSDEYDKKTNSKTCNKSTDEKAKKEWKRDSLSNANSSAFSLHINAYENSKEITKLDTLDGENVDLKRNKTNMDKQLFPRFQNSFEFSRQQEEDQVTEPEVSGFRANQRLLGSNQRGSSVGF
uniref:Uncharacterized protein n=1 Tax=Panagrolaimus sp. PS1159 TaxID=55785 RepID=A0AC35G4J1_9BILA